MLKISRSLANAVTSSRGAKASPDELQIQPSRLIGAAVTFWGRQVGSVALYPT